MIFIFQDKNVETYIFDFSLHPPVSGTKSDTSARVRIQDYRHMLQSSPQQELARPGAIVLLITLQQLRGRPQKNLKVCSYLSA